jgi:hypothetical protein
MTVNLNYSEAAILVSEQLVELERSGFIKILKPFGHSADRKETKIIDADFKMKEEEPAPKEEEEESKDDDNPEEEDAFSALIKEDNDAV